MEGYSDYRYCQLAERWLNGTITPDEEKEFAAWYNKDQDSPLEVPSGIARTEEEYRRLILASIDRRRNPVIPMRRKVWRVASVAAILLVLSFGMYLWRRPASQRETAGVIAGVAPKNDVLPGKTGALLTLDDGTRIDLDTTRTGLLASQGGTAINNLPGSLQYVAGQGDAALRYNTLTTHNGQQYAVILGDGTRMILDASTTVRYPATFMADNRTIEVNGRVWLEVAKDAHRPFYVAKGACRVEVLGTSFDVNAYDDDPNLRVTLVDGSVKVIRGAVFKKLEPGQQAVLAKGNDRIQVIEHADIEEATAWKNGQIAFHGADAGTILREIARWYDVRIAVHGTLPKRTFFLEGSRTARLSELLRGLEVNHIRCSIDVERRVLTVTP